MAFFPSSRRYTDLLRQFVRAPLFDPGTAPQVDPAWPRITVITPSFNQALFLERTIFSIHNQGYPNLEHIVIDGGSTDGSLEILHRFKKRFYHWQTGPDDGQSDAINIGARQATGLYMMWINSDDLLLPGALHTLARAFQKNPDADLVFGNQLEVDRTDRVFKRLYTIDFDIMDFLYEINIIVHQQSALWRTDLFRKIGGLKQYRYAMDYDMTYRMYRAGARFHRIGNFLSAFRVHSAGLTGSGEVAQHRGSEVDEAFRDYMGRDRNLYDRTVMKCRYKMDRFLTEPRSLLAAVEHRMWQWTKGRKRRFEV
jgi:glycosyltransferase involved in cell wall biosynthesis